MLLWYFAYGSNMNADVFRCRRGIVYGRALPARVQGWRLVFDKPPLVPIGESFANLVEDEHASTFGVLYEVADDELAHIDFTEGVQVGNYQRIGVGAEILHPDDGVEANVRAQTLVSSRRDPSLRPSHRYLDLVVAGAVAHGLPQEHIANLRAVPSGESTPEAIEFRAQIDAMMRRPR